MKPFLPVTLAAIGLEICGCSGTSPDARPARTVTITAHPATSRPAAVTPTPGPSTSVAAAGCRTKNLTATAVSPQGSAGGLQLTIVFQNTGTAPCTLAGYPTITQATGAQAAGPGTSVGQPAAEKPAAPRTAVTLPPNGVASARLQIANSANYPASTCKPVKATSLAVVPPGQQTALHVEFGTTACTGSAKIMTVTPVQQGS